MADTASFCAAPPNLVILDRIQPHLDNVILERIRSGCAKDPLSLRLLHVVRDSLSRLMTVLHQNGASTIDGASYTVDATGNRTSKTDYQAAVTSNYSGVCPERSRRDALYELKQVTQAANTTENYTYDPVGNRLSSLTAATMSYNSSNELTATPSTTYTYDANGNTTSKTDSTGTTNYTWDFENRLTSVTLPGRGGTVTFKSDPFGRRVQKAFSQGTNTTTTDYAYDGYSINETTNGAGNIVARYSQTNYIDEPIAIQQFEMTSYYHADGLGSVTSLSNATGGLVQTYTFDSFGRQTASSGSSTNSFQYTGREMDPEENLYYYRARYYDPNAGRFISEDPTSFRADVNFYRYAFDSAVNFGDPLGLQGNANTWTFGEIGSWAWLPTPGYPAPPGLGDAKASIGAACARNGGGCNSVDGSGATDPIGKAAWNNVNNASGTDQSGGGNFMCVGSQGCWFVHRCYGCLNGKRTLMDRPQPLQPSGSVSVGKNTLYFYNDPLQGWCNAADRKSECHCNKGK